MEVYYAEQSDPSYWQWYILLFVVTIIVICLLANTMSNIVNRISGDLRTMPPGNAWLSVIPVFGNFWIFYSVHQVATMLHEEFARRKIVEFETSPGLAVGWGFSFVLFCAQLTLIMDTPLATALLYIATIVMLIIYWTKLAGFRNKLDHDLLAQYPPPQHPFPQHRQEFVPPQQQYSGPNDFPPPPAPPVDEWDKWRPK